MRERKSTSSPLHPFIPFLVRCYVLDLSTIKACAPLQLVRRSCCRCIFNTDFSATGARRHCYHRSFCACSSPAGVLAAELTQQLSPHSFSCSSAVGARRGSCAFAVHEAAVGAVSLHGIGSPCTCTCVDVYWIVISCLRRQCQYAGYPCQQRLVPPQRVLPPRFAVHEASMALAAHTRALMCPGL